MIMRNAKNSLESSPAGREYPGKYWSFDGKGSGAAAFIGEVVQLILKTEDDYKGHLTTKDESSRRHAHTSERLCGRA